MKRLLIITIILSLLSSCAPVIRKEIMKSAQLDVSLHDIKGKPELYKGKSLILGGLIVNTRFTEKGSQIEAVYVPTDSKGYLKNMEAVNGRYLAMFPKEKGLIDPLIYSQGRRITIAVEFIDIQTGKIDEMEYRYPLFEIKEIYLWEEEKYTQPPYYYPYPYGYDRWGRPYPPPWW